MPFRVDVRDLAVGGTGAGAGAGVGELCAELVAKLAKQTGWAKFGIKAAIKGAIGILLYGASYMVGGIPSYFIKMMGFGSFGGIVIDLISTLFPGGIPGISERVAAAIAGAGGIATEAVKVMKEERVEDNAEAMLRALGYQI